MMICHLKRVTIAIFVFLWLTGCVTAMDDQLPYTQLPEIAVTTEVSLVASPSHPASYLSSDPIPSGKRVQVIGTDKGAAWLLVLYDNMLGWMPTIFSRTNVGTLNAPIVFDPLSDKCTKYLGATFDPGEAWVSTTDGSAIVLGSIYRPQAGNQFEDASLVIEIDGKGSAVEADYIHTPLTNSTAVVLLAFSMHDLDKGSQIRFSLSNPDNEPLSFQAAFFSNDCPDGFVDRLPIGKPKVTGAERGPTYQNDATPSNPTPTTSKIIIPSPTHETASFYDEFDSPGLNSNWFWVKEDPSRWSLEAEPGKLRIIATGGDMAFACGNHQNLLLQQAPPGDFEIQTKLTIRPTQNYQQGGVIVFDDPDNYVKLDVLWSDSFKSDRSTSGEGIELLSEQKGNFPEWPWPWSHLKLDNDGIFLKISRNGTWYDGSYSTDGKRWIRVGSVLVPSITNPKAGVFALGGMTDSRNAPNCIHTAPDIPVDFEFFHLISTETSVSTETVSEMKLPSIGD